VHGLEPIIQEIVAGFALWAVGYLSGYVQRQWRKYRRVMKAQDYSYADIRMIQEKLGISKEYIQQNRCRFMRKKSR
jgi:hypothetical protein